MGVASCPCGLRRGRCQEISGNLPRPRVRVRARDDLLLSTRLGLPRSGANVTLSTVDPTAQRNARKDGTRNGESGARPIACSGAVHTAAAHMRVDVMLCALSIDRFLCCYGSLASFLFCADRISTINLEL